MGAPVADVLSETGWDALSDGLPMVVRVLAGPCTLEEIAKDSGESDLRLVEKRLSRLVREGILVKEGERYQAPARLIKTFRQEGMITSLSRHVIPFLSQLEEEPDSCLAIQLDLALDHEEQAGLRSGVVQELVDRLNELSDRPAAERKPHTLVVLGTSDVLTAGAPRTGLLEILKRSARQRSTPDRANRAVLMCYEARFGDPEAAREAVLDAVRGLRERGASALSATPYTMVFGFGANARMDGER